MKNTFNLTVALPGKPLMVFEAKKIIIPCISGYMGIMAHRQPLLSVLDAGIVDITDVKDKKTFFAVSGGFCEMCDNSATILCNSIIMPEEIDLSKEKDDLKLMRDFDINAKEQDKLLYAKMTLVKRLKSIKENS